jgi:hypothetical protein
MKLFVRDLYDETKKRAELKDPTEYSVVCLRCAGTIGGKMTSRISTWHVAACDCCKLKTTVAAARDFIWRT